MWMSAVLDGNGGSRVLQAAGEAAAAAGPDWWTLAAGLLGGVVVAVANHLFTRRRERDKWLRELQAKANQEMYDALEATVRFLAHGTSGAALVYGKEDELDDLRSEMDDLILAFGNKWTALSVVAEQKTRDVADALMESVPDLARLAIPLQGAVNRASKNQTAAAADALAGLAAHLILQMRDEMGLIPWWRWKIHRELRKKSALKHAASRCKPQVDLTEDDEPGGGPSPFEALEWWQVMPLESDTVPKESKGYRTTFVPTTKVKHGDELWELGPLPEVQAVLLKDGRIPWRFGLADGLPAAVEEKLMADASRIVNGHGRVFRAKFRPMHEPVEGIEFWGWKNVADDTKDGSE